jgi:SAM-dependent methyltransferase
VTTPQAVLTNFFGRLPPGRLLNLGAGSTSFSDGRRIAVGLDVKAPPGGLSLFVVGDAATLPFRCASFQGALLKDIIEHVPDPIGVLSEVRRVAGPSARLVLTTPRAISRAVWDDPTHIRGFTKHALRTALDEAGWRITHGPRRMGSLPGAGRLGLVPYIEDVLRVPGIGHWFGTNWIIEAVALP